MRACLLEAFPRKALLDIVRRISLMTDNVAPTSLGFILCTRAMVVIKNYRGVSVRATHMSNVQSAYFSLCGDLWPSELVKQPSSINDIPQVCSGECRKHTLRAELD